MLWDPLKLRNDLDYAIDTSEEDLVDASGRSMYVTSMRLESLLGTKQKMHRKIKAGGVIKALEDLTPAQVQAVKKAWQDSHGGKTLEYHLFGDERVGTTLKDVERVRIRALLQGTVRQPGTQGAGATDGRVLADVAHLRQMLTGSVGEKQRAEIFTMLRRHASSPAVLAGAYVESFTVALDADLAKKLKDWDLERAQALRAGDLARADAAAIEQKRAEVVKLNERIESLDKKASRADYGGYLAGAEADDLRKKRAALIGGMEAVLLHAKEEAGGDRAAAQQAVDAILNTRFPSLISALGVSNVPSTSLREDLDRTLAGNDKAVMQAIATNDAARLAGARLARADSGRKIKPAEVIDALRGLEEQARQDVQQAMVVEVQRIAVDPQLSPEQKEAKADALKAQLEVKSREQAQRYVDEAKSHFETLAEANGFLGGRNFDEMVAATGSAADQELMQALATKGGALDPAEELDLALRDKRKDIDTVRRVLRGKGRAAIQDLEGRFAERTKKSLQVVLFGTPVMTFMGEVLKGGKLSADQRLEFRDFFDQPETLGGQGEAEFLYGRSEAEYDHAIDNRGWSGGLNDATGNEARDLMDRSSAEQFWTLQRYKMLSAAGRENTPEARMLLADLRRGRIRLRSDRKRYEEANAAFRASLASAIQFAVEIALSLALGPGASLLLHAVVGVAANIAVNVLVHGDDYSMDMLYGDVVKGFAGAAGAGIGSMAAGMVVKGAGKVITAKAIEAGMDISPTLLKAGRAVATVTEDVAGDITGNAAASIAMGQDVDFRFGDSLMGLATGAGTDWATRKWGRGAKQWRADQAGGVAGSADPTSSVQSGVEATTSGPVPVSVGAEAKTMNGTIPPDGGPFGPASTTGDPRSTGATGDRGPEPSVIVDWDAMGPDSGPTGRGAAGDSAAAALRDRHEQWLARMRRVAVRDRQLGAPPSTLPDPGTVGRFDNPESAYRAYEAALHNVGGAIEVGVFWSPTTGEYAVQYGVADKVGPPPPEGAWEGVVHYHPNSEGLETYRRPAPSDTYTTQQSSFRSEKSASELVESPVGGKVVTSSQTVFGPGSRDMEVATHVPNPDFWEPGRQQAGEITVHKNQHDYQNDWMASEQADKAGAAEASTVDSPRPAQDAATPSKEYPEPNMPELIGQVRGIANGIVHLAQNEWTPLSPLERREKVAELVGQSLREQGFPEVAFVALLNPPPGALGLFNIKGNEVAIHEGFFHANTLTPAQVVRLTEIVRHEVEHYLQISDSAQLWAALGATPEQIVAQMGEGTTIEVSENVAQWAVAEHAAGRGIDPNSPRGHSAWAHADSFYKDPHRANVYKRKGMAIKHLAEVIASGRVVDEPKARAELDKAIVEYKQLSEEAGAFLAGELEAEVARILLDNTERTPSVGASLSEAELQALVTATAAELRRAVDAVRDLRKAGASAAELQAALKRARRAETSNTHAKQDLARAEGNAALDEMIAKLDDPSFMDFEAGGPMVSIEDVALKDITTGRDGTVTHHLQDVASVRTTETDRDGNAIDAPFEAGPAPSTLLVDEASAGASGPDGDFRPRTDKGEFTARNAELISGPGGTEVRTPQRRSGADHVVGGQRGAVLGPDGSWHLPVESAAVSNAPIDFDPNSPGEFVPRTSEELMEWESSLAQLSPEERYALWYYTDDASGGLNPYLRSGRTGGLFSDPGLLNALTRDIDSAMRPIPMDIQLSRNVGINAFEGIGVKSPTDLMSMVGKDYTDHGVISTSISTGNWGGAVQMVIDAPAGTRGRFVGAGVDSSLTGNDAKRAAEQQRMNPIAGGGGPIASMPSEFELTLERGTTFRILDVQAPSQPGGKWIVHVRVVSQATVPNPVHG